MRARAFRCCAVLAVSSLVGCAYPAGYVMKPGQSAYFGNSITAVEEASVHEVFAASMRAMKELGLRPFEIEKDSRSALIHGTTSNDKDVTVRIEKVNPTLTTVFVDRVVLEKENDEITVVRFTLAGDGSVVRMNSLPKVLTPYALEGA